MTEYSDFKTFLSISSDKFGIYLIETKNHKVLYEKDFTVKNQYSTADFNNLDKFLANNIFKIEKVAGSFIKNILLVIENDYINELNFGIKKKNYEKNINKKFLENILKNAKDLFRENYQKYKIIHILISRYLENGNYHSKFNNEFKGDYLCVEFEFKYISSELTSKISKVLGKYQIDLAGCLDSQYIKNYFSKEKLEFSEMIYKIHNGCNENEVKLIPKNSKKLGFFEKFFRFFS